jgi:hypothetical protein
MDRESRRVPSNPSALDGIEFVEDVLHLPPPLPAWTAEARR